MEGGHEEGDESIRDGEEAEAEIVGGVGALGCCQSCRIRPSLLLKERWFAGREILTVQNLIRADISA